MGIWLLDVTHVLLASQLAFVTVTGVVKDGESEAPIAGAMVSLVDLERYTFSDSVGRYLLTSVPPGPQHVVVRRVGYASRTFHALVPGNGELVIDIALRREPITLQPLEVRTAIPIPGLDVGEGPAFPDRGLSMSAVRNHPLLSEPDVLQAAGGGEIVLSPESPSGIHVRGGASDQLTYLLDGIPVLNPYHAAGTFSAWNPDALSRLDVVTSSLSPTFPDALSGAVSGTTRSPGPRLQTQGSLSTTQSRLTVDGPLANTGVGYLMSFRNASPGLFVNKRESSHVQGNGGDWLGKLDAPLFGGRLSLLGYGSGTEIDAAARLPDPGSTTALDPFRNGLEWESTSLGGGWTLPLRDASIHLRAWHAAGDAEALWKGRDSLPPERLAATRRDDGLVAFIELGPPGSRTVTGVRLQNGRTFYRLRADSIDTPSLELSATTPLAAGFVKHQRSVGARGEVELSVVSTVAADQVQVDPGARVQWKATDELTVSCDCVRRHQYAQSLRNPESVVGNIFPADLYVGADGDRVPVARSDIGIVAVEHRPATGLRFGAQAFARDFSSLLLVAPHDADPFATTGFARGNGRAYGLALRAAANGGRYGVIADYGLQHVRLEHADTSYVPEHGAAHTIDLGVIVFPSPTSSIRLGVTSILGRRTTAIVGPFEWEACNLLDQGCEFAGSPYGGASALGNTRLPPYLRVDLGVRKHWHLNVLGRDVQVAGFGTVTNLLGRKNVLTYAIDPATGARTKIEMRPRSPLVVGVDWRF